MVTSIVTCNHNMSFLCVVSFLVSFMMHATCSDTFIEIVIVAALAIVNDYFHSVEIESYIYCMECGPDTELICQVCICIWFLPWYTAQSE